MFHPSSLPIAAAVLSLVAGSAEAHNRGGKRTLKVPRDYPTIQGAVDAASAGDEIEVGKGRFCGATINKRLTLTGTGKNGAGSASHIVGCASSPILAGVLRIGFLLPGAAGAGGASGTTIRGFAFEGKGISSKNLSPLAFGVFSRFNDKVIVKDNEFHGTVQAITNTAGDDWAISYNRIEDLTVLDCSDGGHCGGGVGIAIQAASAAVGAPGGAANPLNRPEANAVVDNKIEGCAPEGFRAFGMNGILVLSADGTAVVDNQTRIRPGVSDADPLGIGVLVTNTCCGDPTPVQPGASYASLVRNRDHSQFGVVVEGSGGVNTKGLILFENSCRTLVEGTDSPDGEMQVASVADHSSARAAGPAHARGRRSRFE